MHARKSVPLWQPFDSTSAVSSVSFASLGPGIMVDTPNSTFDSSVPPLVFHYVATRTRCQFAAHRVFLTVFEVLDNLYRVLQIFSLFLLRQQIVGSVCRLVVDVTDE